MAINPLTNEVWKQVPGFNGIYKVSSFGRVRASECLRFLSNGETRLFGAKFLKSTPKNTKGYPWVILCHPQTQKRKNAQIHLLVARAFLEPKPSPIHEINHKDGNKKNSKLSNLEWLTHQDNCLHAYRTGLRDTDKNTRYITYKGQTKRVATWAKELGLRPQAIYARLDRGETNLDDVFSKPYGAIWKRRGQKISIHKKQNAPKYKDGLSAIEWASKLEISRATFLWRIKCYDEELVYVIGRYSRKGPGK